MNTCDWVIIGVLIISCLISLKRGFVKEALSLVVWITALLIAKLFSGNLAILLEESIETPSIRMTTAFAILFVATLIVGAMINHLISELVKMTGLSGTDRMFGVIFGALRGLIIVTVILFVLLPMSSDTSWWKTSLLTPYFVQLMDWTKDVLLPVAEDWWEIKR